MILTILPFAPFDAAGVRNALQAGVKGLFRRPIEPMLHLRFVRSVQVHPLGRKYAAC